MDRGNVLGPEAIKERDIIGKVADYICDHNRGKPTDDERIAFKNDLAHSLIYGDDSLLIETYNTLMEWYDEDDEAKHLCNKFAKIAGIDNKDKHKKTHR